MNKVLGAHAVSVDGPSQVFDGFRLSEPSARLLDTLAARVGAEDAVAAAREAAGDKDVSLMGGGVVTAALAAGLVDELVLHQVPILLGGGRPFFQALPEHVRLNLVEAVPAPGVTHLHYEVVR